MILALKVRNLRTAAEPLIEAMALACQTARLSADLVTWVPARPRDKAVRGFDHAEVLAVGVGKRLGLPVKGLLSRRGRQEDQVGLDRTQRFSNLEGAFDASSAHTMRVLLVDDLLTTGATATSCAAALHAAGASAVDLSVACRA